MLLPAVRKAPDDVLVVADGFSCREHIEQGAGRKSLHVAELAAMALGLEGEETDDRESKARPRTSEFLLLAAGIGLAVATAFALVRRNRRQRGAADRA